MEKKKYREILIKSFKGEGYKYREFIEFSEELEKCGAKLEIIDSSVKPFEQYDLNSKKIIDFQKELNSIKKQKNKKNGLGDVIQCSVENGVYEVYEIPIRISDEEYEGKKIPRINGAIFVIKK